MSFQDLHRQRQRAAFIGRISEVETFEQNLLLAPDDPIRRPIVGVSGQGGMGKTTLLNRCREIATEAGAASAWTDEEEKDLLGAMERIVEQLRNRGNFNEFTKKLSKYRETRHKLESSTEAPDEFGRILGATAGRVGLKLARRLPVAGAAFDFVDEESLSAELGEISGYVLQHAGKRQDALLVLDPLEALTPLFLDGLSSVAARAPLALFFDTFEQTQHWLEPWVLRVLSGHFGDVPVNITLAFAGRSPLDMNSWAAYENFLLRLELQIFSEQEAKEFLAQNGLTNPEAVAESIRLAQGLPILLASLAVGDPEDPQVSDTAVERVLRSVREPFRKVAIQGALPRKINRDVLATALPQADTGSAFEWLVGMPFVLTASEGWKYHDVIRFELSQYGRRNSPSAWKEAHERLGAHYKELRDGEAAAGDGEAAFDAQLERLYHGVCVGTAGHIGTALALCIQAWNIEPRLTVLWAMTIRDAESDAGRDGNAWGQAWLDAVQSMFDGHEREAIPLFSRVLDSDLISEDVVAEALMARSDLFFRQGRLDAALVDIDRAIEIRPDDPRLRHERAWIYWRADDEVPALENSRDALKLLDADDGRRTNYQVMSACIRGESLGSAQLVDILNDIPDLEKNTWGLLNRGTAFLDLGVYGAAIRDFKKVLALKNGRIDDAWLGLGDTYYAQDKAKQAASAYKRAIEAYRYSVGAWNGLAMALSVYVDKDLIPEELAKVCQDDQDDSLTAYRAIGLLQIDRRDLARQEMAKAIDQDPSQADFRLWMARIEALEKRWGVATREIEKALQLRNDWPEALALRGLCRSCLNDHAGAVADWERAEAMNVAEARSIDPNERGLSLSVIGRYDEAIAMFDRVNPDERGAVLHYNRAVAACLRDGLEAVRPELENAAAILSTDEDKLSAAYGQAGIQCLLGDDDQALDGLLEARDIDAEKVERWAMTDPAWNRLRGSADFDRIMNPAIK